MTQPWSPEQPPSEPVNIRQFAPQRSVGPALWLLIIGMTALGIVLGGLLARSVPLLSGGQDPTPGQSAPVAAGPGLPFELPMGAGAGRWEIVETEWDSGGVHLKVRIDCDSGRVSYGFAAFANNGENVINPSIRSREPALTAGTLNAGQSKEGWLYLKMPREDGILLLTTGFGRQTSALAFKG